MAVWPVTEKLCPCRAPVVFWIANTLLLLTLTAIALTIVASYWFV